MNLTKEWIINQLPQRPVNAHKGTFGKLLVVAGSKNYPGASYLACAAAYRTGAGLVTLVTEAQVKMIVSRKLPELTFLTSLEVFKRLYDYDVCLLGPGLGQEDRSIKFMKGLLKRKLPKIVVDGDGLSILSQEGEWWTKIRNEAVLTPHPGEMGRLTGLSIEKIQSDRINVAQYFAKKWQKTLVLKGANTVIASPAGQVAVAPFANPALATAGTGDVLAGAIAGMLVQGLKTFAAACAGVYVHGMAGEVVKKELGDTGAIASDLLSILPLIIKKLR